MEIKITLVGTQPLLMHDIGLSDPDNKWTRQIAAITSKRKKTDEDRKQIELLEWYGGLILAPGVVDGLAWKTAAIRKCLINAGKITKQGTQIGRALAFTRLYVPFLYDGPREIDKLYQSGKFANRASVAVGTSRVWRVRPEFPTWTVEADAEFIEDVMNPDDLMRIANLAGKAEGLGDNRINGYGRFKAEIIFNG